MQNAHLLVPLFSRGVNVYDGLVRSENLDRRAILILEESVKSLEMTEDFWFCIHDVDYRPWAEFIFKDHKVSSTSQRGMRHWSTYIRVDSSYYTTCLRSGRCVVRYSMHLPTCKASTDMRVILSSFQVKPLHQIQVKHPLNLSSIDVAEALMSNVYRHHELSRIGQLSWLNVSVVHRVRCSLSGRHQLSVLVDVTFVVDEDDFHAHLSGCSDWE